MISRHFAVVFCLARLDKKDAIKKQLFSTVFIDGFLNFFSQYSFDNGDFERHINRVRRGLRKQNKNYIAAFFSICGIILLTILRLKNFVVHFGFAFISTLYIRVLIFTIMTFFHNNYEII